MVVNISITPVPPRDHRGWASQFTRTSCQQWCIHDTNKGRVAVFHQPLTVIMTDSYYDKHLDEDLCQCFLLYRLHLPYLGCFLIFVACLPGLVAVLGSVPVLPIVVRSGVLIIHSITSTCIRQKVNIEICMLCQLHKLPTNKCYNVNFNTDFTYINVCVANEHHVAPCFSVSGHPSLELMPSGFWWDPGIFEDGKREPRWKIAFYFGVYNVYTYNLLFYSLTLVIHDKLHQHYFNIHFSYNQRM